MLTTIQSRESIENIRRRLSLAKSALDCASEAIENGEARLAIKYMSEAYTWQDMARSNLTMHIKASERPNRIIPNGWGKV